MSDPTILEQIALKRSAHRREEQQLVSSLTGGRRSVPVLPFFAEPGLICEIKRASPSRGEIIPQGEDISAIFQQYCSSGAHRFSVLTESSYFKGSCSDLFRLKQEHPHLPMLRKDFLCSLDDIRESYFIGADAVLLIAALLDDRQLGDLTSAARQLGMQVLSEVHDEQELRRVLALPVLPDALGINARDLTTFKVNIKTPYALKARMNKPIPLVYESGIRCPTAVFHAANAGFHGVLIGEACMEEPGRTERIASFKAAFTSGASTEPVLFTRLFQKMHSRPLVKICGITSIQDAAEAQKMGADLIGLIIADSPRSIPRDHLTHFSDLDVPILAVTKDPDEQQVQDLLVLLDKGIIQGVQLHGDEPPELMERFSARACKALPPGSLADATDQRWGPFTLFDLPKDSTMNIMEDPHLPLLDRQFLAGGITPELAGDLVIRSRPLLIDLASGVEHSPGYKDHRRMKQLFDQLEGIYG